MIRHALPLFTLLILALGFLAVRSRGGEADEAELTELYAQARTSYIEKDYRRCIDYFQRYVAKLPANPDSSVDGPRARAHYGIAASHIALGDLTAAYENLEQAIDHGLWNARLLRSDPTLEPLRGSASFPILVEKAEKARSRMAFGLKDLDGKVVREKDFEGKVLIIDVWGTWCPPCRMEIPHFVELQEKYRDEGLRIIGVTFERRDPDDALRQHVKRFAKTLEINYPCVMATRDMISAISVGSFPTTFFIDRKGRIRDVAVGYKKLEDLESRVRPLLAEKPEKAAKAAPSEKATEKAPESSPAQ